MIRQMYHTEGLFVFWKGTLPTILRNVPGSALYFGILKEMRDAFKRWNSNVVNLTSGAIARAVMNHDFHVG
jgi:solute carrier family 25 protein 38